MSLNGTASQTPCKINKAAFQAINDAKDTEIGRGSYHDPDTPRDQDHHHREHDADRKFRPHLAAKYECLKTEGSRKRHRATDQRRQTNDLCEN